MGSIYYDLTFDRQVVIGLGGGIASSTKGLSGQPYPVTWTPPSWAFFALPDPADWALQLAALLCIHLVRVVLYIAVQLKCEYSYLGQAEINHITCTAAVAALQQSLIQQQ